MVVVSLYHLMRSFTDQMTIEKTHPTLHDIVDLQARELRLKCSQKENIPRGFDVLFLSAEFQTEPPTPPNAISYPTNLDEDQQAI